LFQIWHDYCLALEKAKTLLDLYRFNDEPVANLAGLHYNIEKVGHAQSDVSAHQSEIDLLNERAREVTRLADNPTRMLIEQHLLSVNSEWNEVVSTMESRREALMKLAEQWEVRITRIFLEFRRLGYENQLLGLIHCRNSTYCESNHNDINVLRCHVGCFKNLSQDVLEERNLRVGNQLPIFTDLMHLQKIKVA